MKPTLIQCGLILCSLVSAGWARLPEGFKALEEDNSPNGQYGVMFPDEEHSDLEDPPNYLVDLKAKTIVVKIKDGHYFAHANHRSLETTWAEDSSLLVVELGGRWGYDAVVLLELKQAPVRQTAIGAEVRRQLDAVLKKATHNPYLGAGPAAYYDFVAPGMIEFYATSTTNPKGFGDVPTYTALFHGRYSLAKHRWVSSTAQSISKEQDLDFSATFTAVPEREEEDLEEMRKEEGLDMRLNQAYRTLRLLLPAERFAQVKQEQTAWLPKRDTEQEPRARRDCIRQRIITLEKLLW